MKKTIFCLLALACVSTMAPLYASPVTIDFSGTADFSSVGGPATSAYSGSVTWDPTESPFLTNTNSGGSYAEYDASSTFVLGGTDYSADILRTVISVATGTALFQDFQFGIIFHPRLFDLVNFMNFYPTTPTDTFSSTALPNDLSFLSGITDGVSGASTVYGDFRTGPVSITAAVPEPSSLTLTVLGVLCSVAWNRRRRRFG